MCRTSHPMLGPSIGWAERSAFWRDGRPRRGFGSRPAHSEMAARCCRAECGQPGSAVHTPGEAGSYRSHALPLSGKPVAGGFPRFPSEPFLQRPLCPALRGPGRGA